MDSDDDQDIARRVQIMTTMHFVLSSARMSTVSESVGRSGMYLTTISMTLVALGFISSATDMGDGLYVLTFVLLLCLIPIGIVTFNRVVQTGVQDLRLSYQEARIRAFYAEVSPGIDRWFDRPVTDAEANRILLSTGGARFQMLFTAGSMVGGVNSAVIGVFIGLAIMIFAGTGLILSTVLGAVAFVISGWIHMRRQNALFAALKVTPI